jgi:hypothetical protein
MMELVRMAARREAACKAEMVELAARRSRMLETRAAAAAAAAAAADVADAAAAAAAAAAGGGGGECAGEEGGEDEGEGRATRLAAAEHTIAASEVRGAGVAAGEGLTWVDLPAALAARSPR